MDDMMKPWLAWVFIAALVIAFFFIFIRAFGLGIFDISEVVLDYPKISGAAILLVVAGLASWVMTRS
jgi:nitroreductase